MANADACQGSRLCNSVSGNSNSIRGRISWAALGNIAFAAFQWLLVVLVARLGGPEIVGQFATAIAITTPVFMLANLGLRTTLATDVGRQFPFLLYFAIRIMSSVIGLVLTIAIAASIGYRGDILQACAILACYRLVESLSDVIYGEMQLGGRMRAIALSQISRSLCSILAITFLLYATGSLKISLIAMTIVSILTLTLYDLRHAERIKAAWETAVLNEDGRPKWNAARTLVTASLPIGIAMTLASLELNVPRLIIERSLGIETLGAFSVVTSIAVVASVFMSSISQAILPGLAQRFANGNVSAAASLVRRLALVVGSVSLICTIGVYWIGAPLLALLYGDHYADYRDVLVVVVFAMAIGAQGWLLNALLIAARYPEPIARVSLVSTIFVGVTTAAVVEHAGLTGIAWVLVASSALQVSIKLLVVMRLINQLKFSAGV